MIAGKPWRRFTLVRYGILATLMIPAGARAVEEPIGETVPESARVWPMPEWQKAEPEQVGLDAAELARARAYALTGGGSGYITRHGRLVMAWGDPRKTLRPEVDDQVVRFDRAGAGDQGRQTPAWRTRPEHHPSFGVPPEENAETGWLDEITHPAPGLADGRFREAGRLHAAAVSARHAMGLQRLRAELAGRVHHAGLRTRPGRMDVRAGVHAAGHRRRGSYVAEERLPTRGRSRASPRREFGSGIHANVDAMARIGYLMLRERPVEEQEILTEDYVQLAPRTPPGHERLPVLARDATARPHHITACCGGTMPTGRFADVPRDAYWSWGLYDSLIVVIPSLDIVVARAGKSWDRERRRGPLRRAEAVPRADRQAVQRSSGTPGRPATSPETQSEP